MFEDILDPRLVYGFGKPRLGKLVSFPCREYRNMLYRDYVGIIPPYSPVSYRPPLETSGPGRLQSFVSQQMLCASRCNVPYLS